MVQIAVLVLDNGSIALSAMRNFLNKDEDFIKSTAQVSLLGNLREVIGTLDLRTLCQDKAKFSLSVKESAEHDMEELGIRIISFNVQDIRDDGELIKNLGIENTEQIRKDAQISKARARQEVEIATADADNLSNQRRVDADLEIAKRNQALDVERSRLAAVQATEKAKADIAYEIQKETSRREVEIAKQDADIAQKAKEIELQEKEVLVAERKLEAEIKKKAEADKFAEIQKADADLYRRQKDAEAKLYEQQKEAEAVRAKGLADAEAIRATGEAEAVALDKKAKAMQKYGQAAILEMLVGVLPDIAKAIAEPISAIEKVTVIGGDSSGVADISGNVPLVLSKVMESVKEATGVDLKDIIDASTYDAKVTRNINVTGLEGVKESISEVIEEATE